MIFIQQGRDLTLSALDFPGFASDTDDKYILRINTYVLGKIHQRNRHQ